MKSNKYFIWVTSTWVKNSNIYFWYLSEFKNLRLYGAFEFRRPVVGIRDPKIVKQLAVKDFDYFSDHRVIITEDIDPWFGKILISLQGQRWKGK